MSHAYPAPAKLNLFLHVVGRRADGYHLLQSVFRFIDRVDTVHLELRDDGRVVREGDLPGVPEEFDLTVRAARLLQAHAPGGAGVSIRLDKVLPHVAVESEEDIEAGASEIEDIEPDELEPAKV